MRPVKRFSVNKHRSAKKFRRNVSKTHRKNVKFVDRGGYRL